MQFSLLLKLAALAVTTTATMITFNPAKAISFGEKEVEKDRFVVVAAPYHHGYNLLLIEQIPGKQKCWGENGLNPVKVNPLLLNFDFTGSCKRSTDSNNYSLRIDGKDYGLDYLFNIVKKDGELHLVATPRNPNQPEIFIGRTYGMSQGSLKIFLNPGWRLTKRTYEGETVEHIYLSGNLVAIQKSSENNSLVGSAKK
jgi:hypothetical protein